eukprot:5241650-Pyramimonas_sp.AAC.1
MKRERESTGRAPALNLKKQRDEDYELNVSPLKEGFFRSATASGEWQPTIPAVVEDGELVGQLATYAQLITRDEKDEEFLNAPKPLENTFGRDLLQGAILRFLRWGHVGTPTLTARLRRRADAQGKPTGHKAHVGTKRVRIARTFATSATCNGCARSVTQWAIIIAHLFLRSLFRARPGWRKPTLKESF